MEEYTVEYPKFFLLLFNLNITYVLYVSFLIILYLQEKNMFDLLYIFMITYFFVKNKWYNFKLKKSPDAATK